MDWTDTRKAIEAAYKELGETHTGNLPKRDWNLVDASLKAFMKQQEFTCGECSKPIAFRCEIVCLDCRMPLHEGCAPNHFWPNGRPKGERR